MPNNTSGDLTPKRFRIALSFAGEKRAFVEKVASILAGRFGEDKILYDKFHEAEFAEADLAFDLPEFYKSNSDLIVAVFCPNYYRKEWCGLEWRAIFSIIKEGGKKQILLSRFDRIDGKGLFGLAGFIELDMKTPEQFVTLILQRLAINEGLPKDHYVKRKSSRRSKSSPLRKENNPFQTAAALRHDHPTYIRRQVDGQFQRVLTGPDPLISVTGEYGIGKTSLMQQARRILPDHLFFGGGLADMGGHDETRFVKNIFKLFSERFGPISDWDELDLHARTHPSVLLLDDIGEVASPGLGAFVPALVNRLSKVGCGLRAIATSPTSLQSVFFKRGLENPKYSKPWKTIHVIACKEYEALCLFDLLPPRGRTVAKNQIGIIERFSKFAPQRLQCLCHRLFDAECDGLSDKQLTAIIVDESNYA